ncbi:hypothetical protein, conserved [Leishmania tarentolae]|uniref:Uncharacterized protein n=1 Tax=Leishmania tarentolae TaxID=5689 RepID=A0A640KQH1_LEITA|nr:hypothetical protein, conserved [Leishmania tarentolae]
MPRQTSRGPSPGTSGRCKGTVESASRLPSCAPASRSPRNVDEPGVFLLLNGFVCRTADSSGRFCPVDLFSGVHREAATAFPTIPSANGHRSLCNGSAEETRLSIDSDCPLFNCFGVLSGGVIIDPINSSFVEFTDSAVYTPSTVLAHVGTTHETHDDLARCTLQQANEQAFRTGETHMIRPECPLTLCTSELPLPPWSCDEPAKSFKCRPSSLSAAGSSGPTVTSARHAAQMGMENVAKWLSRLPPSSDDNQRTPKRQAWTAVWADAEEFRLSLRAHNDVRASEASLYLPPRIPFPLSFRGQPISLTEEGEKLSAPSQQQQQHPQASSTAAVPSDGVRCTAASFTCYTGVPRFAAATATAPRSDSAEFVTGTAVTRLRKRLRPYCETASRGRRGASNDHKEEDEERFLIPFTDSTPRHAAFALFLLYFNHLGVLCNGVRVTGETEASSCCDRLDIGTTTWGLCPKHLYDVRAEVERKRRVTRELREDPEKTFAGGTRWSTTARNREAVTAAWTALLLSSRTALLERIAELNCHIHKLHDEKQRRRYTNQRTDG